VAHPRHKRETNARRLASRTGMRTAAVAVGAAAAVTVPAVGFGLVHVAPAAPLGAAAHRQQPLRLDPERYDSVPVSRTFDRTAARTLQEGVAAEHATARAVRQAHVRRWSTVDLNLWSSSSRDAEQVGLLPAGKRVLVTGRAAGGRVEVVVRGQSRWVTAGYLADAKPASSDSSSSAGQSGSGQPVSAGLSMAACPDGSVEYRLTAAAVYVYRSVCHAFPQITAYSGWDAHGEHVTGRALDIMTSDVALGNEIAAFLQAHAAELHVYDILWRQHIWTPVRASEGWRLFADRGSATANHMDHVHVSVY
jgi:uncharacterized protein YraI